MVGTIPCKLASELHVARTNVVEAGGKGPAGGNADEPMPKRVRLMSMRGREIVGPGYSESASESGMDVEVRRNEKRKPCPGSGSKRAR
jgi:hypothetical protein